MADILGPASAPHAVTMRPADGRVFSVSDSWFKDCTSPDADDGTDLQSGFLNGVLGALRSLWRVNGKRADGVTPVNPEVGTDDGGLAKAIQQLIQRGQPSYGIDTGAANSLVVSMTPALVEYKAGVRLRIKVNVTNTGPTVIDVNGLGEREIRHPNGSALAANDLYAGGIAILDDDGDRFQLVASHTDLLGGDGAGFRVPYITATGSPAAIVATYDPSTPTPLAGHLFAVKLIAALPAGGVTFAPDGHGPYPVKTPNGSNPPANYALVNDRVLMLFDGANFIIVSKTSSDPVASYPLHPDVGSYYMDMNSFSILVVGSTVSIAGKPGAWKVLNSDSRTFASTPNNTDGAFFFNFTYVWTFYQRIA